MLNIVDKLNEWIDPFKAWLEANHNNPFVWLGFFIAGLIVFSVTFSSLHRDGS